MNRVFVVTFCLAASVFAYACKDDPNRPAAATDTGQATSSGAAGGKGDGGGAGDGGSTDAGDAAAACNTLTNDGNVLDQNRIVGEPPTGTGGTIVDGTY